MTYQGSGTSRTDESSLANVFPVLAGSTNAFWLAANEGTDTTTDEAAISNWTDRARSINFAQGSGSLQPTYESTDLLNGLPVIDFNEDALEAQSGLDLFSSVDGITGFMVTKSDNLSGLRDVISLQRFAVPPDTTSPSGGNRYKLSTNDSEYRLGGRRLDDDSFESFTGGTLNTTDWNLGAGIIDYNTADGAIYQNGSVASTDTTFLNTGLSDANPLEFVTVGTQSGASGIGFDGQMAEVIMFNTAVASNDIDTINTYLNTKYELYSQSNLPDVTVAGSDTQSTVAVKL
jgi:hypothetical protein